MVRCSCAKKLARRLAEPRCQRQVLTQTLMLSVAVFAAGVFARGTRKNWTTWGNQADDDYKPTWKTYAHHSRAGLVAAE